MAANVITGIRILCALSLTFCPTFSTRFYVFYIVGGISDVLDGIAARSYGKETKFGAQFDTAADVVLIILTCATATAAAIQEEHYIRVGKEIG